MSRQKKFVQEARVAIKLFNEIYRVSTSRTLRVESKIFILNSKNRKLFLGRDSRYSP